jgi:Fe2+ transport system protein B
MPMVLALNMMDESAKTAGLLIICKMSEELGIPSRSYQSLSKTRELDELIDVMLNNGEKTEYTRSV